MIELIDAHAWYDLMPGRAPMLYVTASCAGLMKGQSAELRRRAAALGKPSIIGPTALSRSSPPPTFSVDPGGNRFYAVEIATRPELLNPANPRSNADFFGTWQVGDLLTAPTYTLDPAVWERLKTANRLYYRIVTSASDRGFVASVPSVAASDVARVPFITISDSAALASGGERLSLELVVSGQAGTEPAPPMPIRYREARGAVKYARVIIEPLGLELPVEDVH